MSFQNFVKRNDFSSAGIDMLRYAYLPWRKTTYHCFVSQAKFQCETSHVNPSYKTWCRSNWRYVAPRNTMHWRPCNLALKIVHGFTDACQSYLIDVENRYGKYNSNIGLIWYFCSRSQKTRCADVGQILMRTPHFFRMFVLHFRWFMK